MFLEAINEISQPALMLILPVLAGALTVYVVKLWQKEKVKLSLEQSSLLNWITNTAVWSIEQAYAAGIIPKELRLEKATLYVQNQADSHGISVDVSEIVTRIEAVLAQELNKEKLKKHPPHAETPA